MRLSKKPTKWASKSLPMLARLSRRCSKTHRHQVLEGGRPKVAEIYPPELVLEIRRGMRGTEDLSCNAISHAEDSETRTSGDVVSKFDDANSAFLQIDDDKSWQEELRDRDLAAAVQKEQSKFASLMPSPGISPGDQTDLLHIGW